MAKPGVKTILNDGVILQLREHVLKGRNVQEVANITGLKENTLYDWKANNYMNLQTHWNTWELQRKLAQAEAFSEQLMDLPSYEDDKLNTKLLSIKQREAEFLRTSLLIARSKYDKREANASTGNVQVNIINYTAKPLENKPFIDVTNQHINNDKSNSNS